MVTIDDAINSMTAQIARLEKRNEINVVMRIDEVLAFDENMREKLIAIKEGQEFDLVADLGDNVTATYKVGETSISAGSNVLDYGDKLKITITYAEGYEKDTLTVNGKDYVSGTVIDVVTNIKLVATAKAIPTPPEPEE